MNRPATRAMSLIEMLAVLGLIGLLAAVAIPSFMEARKTTNEVAAVQTLRGIYQAETIYRDRAMGGEQTYAELGDLITTGLIDLPLETELSDEASQDLPKPAALRKNQIADRKALASKHTASRKERQAGLRTQAAQHREQRQTRQAARAQLQRDQLAERKALVAAMRGLKGAERAAARTAYRSRVAEQRATSNALAARDRDLRAAEAAQRRALRGEHAAANQAARAERRDLAQQHREARIDLRQKILARLKGEAGDSPTAVDVVGRSLGYIFAARPAEKNPHHQWFGWARPATEASGQRSFVIDNSGQVFRAPEEGFDFEQMVADGRLPAGLEPVSGR